MQIGDVIAQQVIEKRGWAEHDLMRTTRMTVFGGIFAGPILSNWYRFIDKIVTTQSPSKGIFCQWFNKPETKLLLYSFVLQGCMRSIYICSFFHWR